MVGVHGDRGGDDPVLEAPVLGRVGGPTYDSTRLQEQTRAAQWNVTAGARFCPPRVTARRHRRPGHWVPRCLPRTRPDAPGRGDVPERRRTHRAPAGSCAAERELGAGPGSERACRRFGPPSWSSRAGTAAARAQQCDGPCTVRSWLDRRRPRSYLQGTRLKCGTGLEAYRPRRRVGPHRILYTSVSG